MYIPLFIFSNSCILMRIEQDLELIVGMLRVNSFTPRSMSAYRELKLNSSLTEKLGFGCEFHY